MACSTGIRVVMAGALALSFQAAAASPCQRAPGAPDTYASRIAALACAENQLWFGPFIDVNGRLARMSVSEAEKLRLSDGATPAWRRVADYWKGSGMLWQMSGYPGAADCSAGESGAPMQMASCRAFLVDTPWSAVFVTYVMNRAGVPGFLGSASHIDYVRAAFHNPAAGPYSFADPDTTPASPGDMLCFSRTRATYGYPGMRSMLAANDGAGLAMHCDIVVAASPGGDHRLYLVGGNVLQGVTMRVLNLNRQGLPWGLPRRTGGESECRPDNEDACNFNRQDWVALLKLNPLPAPTRAISLPSTQPACCTACPLPMPEGMRRCAAPASTPPMQAPTNP
ncbi:DUF2272 domain-containing protein [Agrilutibacter solisilvae]|uniref:DUF2272 domain-containing protein n=1 Tax=Agrilutibacter solisilvae TaxID=2763317 RepID=A0A975ARC0_9GAMM|nr:DUF2272 domain-containing protein [Lysobacter solisilvae]QSX77719.1 DUF2272 domain-containing protein [Lysobacter solisilvae]